MQSKKLVFIALFFSAQVSALATGTWTAAKPGRIPVLGPYGAEALSEVLSPNGVKALFEGFSPEFPGWEIKKEEPVWENDKLRIKYSLQSPQPTEPALDKKAPSPKGKFKKLLGRLAGEVVQEVVEMIPKDINGLVTRTEIACPGKGSDSKGYRLHIDFKDSSKPIFNKIEQLSIRLCTKTTQTEDLERLEMNHQFSVILGRKAARLADAQTIVQTWAENIMSMVEEKVMKAQIHLIKKNMAPSDEEQGAK